MTGPAQAAVGSEVTFRIVVANRGNAPAVGLKVKDRFGSGLEHTVAKSPIELTLGDLAVGKSKTVNVTFRVTQPGQLCHAIEVTGEGGIRATSQGCVVAVAAGVTRGGNQPSPPTPPGVAPARGGEPLRQPPPGQRARFRPG